VSAGSPTGIAGDEQALQQRGRAFVSAWRTGLKRWHPDRARVLHQELELLAANAEAQQFAPIAEAALQLAVDLSSFVDTDTSPNVAQRDSLEHLVDRLAAAVGEKTAQRASAEFARHRQSFILGSEASDSLRLAEQLGQRGWLVRPFHEPESLVRALVEVSPDLLIVDEAFADKVNALVAAAQRRRHPHSDPVLCVLLASKTDITRTQFALRAGADAVIVERDPIALVAQIETLLAQRRSVEYRVLIVEDDRSQAKFCEAILRHRGVATAVCDEAGRVFDMIAEFNPDLVLLDLYLPGGNGIEIAQRIRGQPANAFLPIVFLSGEQDVNLRFDAIRVGADDFITKPVKPSHLLTTVESRIKRGRELRAGRRENRGERRGIFSSREVLAREMVRAAREKLEYPFAIALIAVDGTDEVLQRIGFVNAGILPQQVASAIAAELSGSPMLCAWGELHFLALLHAAGEADLRGQLETVRSKLDTRVWLSAESPLRLSFSLGCMLLPPELSRVEKLLDQVRGLCRRAQQSGGGRCGFDFHPALPAGNEDARQRMVRALLHSSSIRSAARFEFQPLVPVLGLVAGIYEVRVELKPPNSSQISGLARSEYLPVARDLGIEAHVERQLLSGLFDLLRERHATDTELHLHVPVSVNTALDPAFPPWLSAELRAHGVPSGVIGLLIALAQVRDGHARLRSTLPDLQRAGVRLVLDGRNAMYAAIDSLLDVEDFAFVKFARASERPSTATAWDACSGMVAKARALGKVTVACDVGGIADLAALARLGVHYVQGDALTAWLPDWSFEFPET